MTEEKLKPSENEMKELNALIERTGNMLIETGLESTEIEFNGRTLILKRDDYIRRIEEEKSKKEEWENSYPYKATKKAEETLKGTDLSGMHVWSNEEQEGIRLWVPNPDYKTD